MLVSNSGKQERAASAHTWVEFIQTQPGTDKGFAQRLLKRHRNQNTSGKRLSVKGAGRAHVVPGRAGGAGSPAEGAGARVGAPEGPGSGAKTPATCTHWGEAGLSP